MFTVLLHDSQGVSTADRVTASGVRQRGFFKLYEQFQPSAGRSVYLTLQTRAWTVFGNLEFKFSMVEAMNNDVFWNEACYLLKFTGVSVECFGLYFRIYRSKKMLEYSFPKHS
jgi:hypothetical protein